MWLKYLCDVEGFSSGSSIDICVRKRKLYGLSGALLLQWQIFFSLSLFYFVIYFIFSVLGFEVWGVYGSSQMVLTTSF